MKNIMHSIVFAFREILKWHTMKYVLIGGILISGLWIVVGVLYWDYIIDISSHVLSWVPFSMVRSNGAWMLSAFIWLVLILLTFALVFSFFGNFILRYVSKDKYSSFSIWVALGSTLFWSAVWFFEEDYIYTQFLKLLTWLPFETIEKGIAFLIGFYIIYSAITVSILFVASFFSEPLIASIEQEHFADDSVVRNHLFSSLRYTIKDTLIFILLSIVAFPLLFVPIINIFVQIALWIWLTKDTISYDALSLTMENINKTEIKRHKKAVWFISFVATLFNFVPLLNLFGAYFGEIAMFHYLKELYKK